MNSVDHVQCMPIITTGNDDRINVLALEQFAVIPDLVDLVLKLPCDFVHVRAIRIANRDKFHTLDAVSLLGETLATATTANEGHTDRVVGAPGLAVAER